jgi:hypothetical protein
MQTISMLLRSKSCLSQIGKEFSGKRRIYKLQKLGHLLPILREMQDQRVFVRIRPNVTVGCARRMHNTRMRVCIMHLCVNSNLRQC